MMACLLPQIIFLMVPAGTTTFSYFNYLLMSNWLTITSLMESTNQTKQLSLQEMEMKTATTVGFDFNLDKRVSSVSRSQFWSTSNEHSDWLHFLLKHFFNRIQFEAYLWKKNTKLILFQIVKFLITNVQK